MAQPQGRAAAAANVHLAGAGALAVAAAGAGAPAAGAAPGVAGAGAPAVGAAAGGAAAAAPAPAFIRPAVMPEAYDGTSDWAEYVQYFEQCALINGWGDPQKAQFLAVRLRDAAQRFYSAIPVARKHNWQHVCHDMGHRFAPAATAPLFKAQFKSRRRATGEDLAQLADDLRRMVVRAYPNMPDGDRGELVRDQFIESLTPVALRVRLQENPPADIQAAVEVALHLERVWGSVDMPAGAASRLVGPYGDSTATQLVATADVSSGTRPDNDVVQLAKAVAALTTKLDKAIEVRQGSFHAESQDRYRRPPPQPWRPAGQQDPLRCRNCRKVGHFARDCWARPVGIERGRPIPPRPGAERNSLPPAGNGK